MSVDSRTSWIKWYDKHKLYLELWDRRKFLRMIGMVHSGTATTQQARWFGERVNRCNKLAKKDRERGRKTKREQHQPRLIRGQQHE